MNYPFVSVVTPFFNTAPYLAECIESVLAQNYTNFEYILLDNCSTDGSREIAEAYARRDSRIRLIRCSEFLSQLANYNRALAEISDESVYCKVVQADDWIFPECLQLMVAAFEQSETIGLVSSYWLDGNNVCGSGLSPQTAMVSGTDCILWYLRTGTCPFAAQTQVMYRASLLRQRETFYNVSFPFADLQKHLEILEHWDFGFVHQVLSFSRRDNEGSILRSLQRFAPSYLLSYIFALRYAPVLMEAGEVHSIIAKYKRNYYRFLARALFQLRGRAFWQFQKAGLKTLNENEDFDRIYLAMMIGLELVRLALNPGTTIALTVRSLKGKGTQGKLPQTVNSARPISPRVSDVTVTPERTI